MIEGSEVGWRVREIEKECEYEDEYEVSSHRMCSVCSLGCFGEKGYNS